MSRLNLAEGLKKAGSFGGIFLSRDEEGTNNLVRPSTVSIIPSSSTAIKGILFLLKISLNRILLCIEALLKKRSLPIENRYKAILFNVIV